MLGSHIIPASAGEVDEGSRLEAINQLGNQAARHVAPIQRFWAAIFAGGLGFRVQGSGFRV